MDIDISYDNGMMILTTLYKGILYQHRYLFYTEYEAIQLFKQYVIEEDSKIIREI